MTPKPSLMSWKSNKFKIWSLTKYVKKPFRLPERLLSKNLELNQNYNFRY